MTSRIEELDSGNVSDDQLARYQAFQSVILAERLPEDPLPPFGAMVRSLRNPGPNVHTTGIAAAEDGIWTGVALALATDGDDRTVRVDMAVLPDHRGRGTGQDLLRRVASAARACGREFLVADTYDTVPAGVAFAERIGAEPGLRGHVNRLALADVDREMVEHWIDEGPSRAPGYELVAFDSPTPDHLVDAVADILNVINDAPTDDLETAPLKITGETFQAFEQLGVSSGIEVWWLLALEKSTGLVVGQTDVRWDPRRPTTVTQGTTVVREDHRGHALGKWLKATMLKRVLQERAEAVDIKTSNADSNAPMLGINDKLGFRPYVGTTTWQVHVDRVLADGRLEH
jgi:mycothiol synthase